MDAVSQIALLLGAGAAASFSYRAAQNQPEAQRTHTLVISLASVFIALAALAELLLTSPDQDTMTLRRMLTNLATYAGLPLISSALLALARGWEWSSAAWGRWLLVLFAMFELCRRSGVGEQYSEGLNVAIAAVWLISTLLLGAGLAKLLAILSALLATSALLLFSPQALLGTANVAFYSLALAAALVLLGTQIRTLVPIAAKDA